MYHNWIQLDGQEGTGSHGPSWVQKCASIFSLSLSLSLSVCVCVCVYVPPLCVCVCVCVRVHACYMYQRTNHRNWFSSFTVWIIDLNTSYQLCSKCLYLPHHLTGFLPLSYHLLLKTIYLFRGERRLCTAQCVWKLETTCGNQLSSSTMWSHQV